MACERCGHVDGIPDERLGERAAVDVLFAALAAAGRFAKGDIGAKRETAILDALQLALSRADDEALDGLERWATRYVRDRKPAERWSTRHAAWSDNASTITGVVAVAKRVLRSPTRVHDLAAELRGAFPYLPAFSGQDAATWDSLKAALLELARGQEDAELFAVRALVAAGMDVREAHQRFAFLRVARSRTRRAARLRRRAERANVLGGG